MNREKCLGYGVSSGRSLARWSRLPYATAILVLLSGLPAPAAAQVPAQIDIRDGQGRVSLRNPSSRPLRVRIALCESDETGPEVRLLGDARGTVWPVDFELPPGELQVIRLVVPRDAYAPGFRLRLETRLMPLAPEPSEGGGTGAQVILATRILSKVIIH